MCRDSVISEIIQPDALSAKRFSRRLDYVAPVRFAFPLEALQFLLPELYPEAAIRED
jgi:hypothetical protein